MPAKKREKRPADAELLTMLKASGLLNPNVTLDELMKLSAKLDVGAQARGFIFRDFIYRPC
jgi:ribosome-associated protein YbcJ (S4-like RNA binding protein)